jgi:hypothetical protein
MLLRVLCKSGSELSQGGYRLTFLARVVQEHFHEEHASARLFNKTWLDTQWVSA